jgi:hypothetical protein
MTITRVRELVNEMKAAPTPVVCSFNVEQMIDLLAEIDRRIQPVAAQPPPPPPAPIEVSPVSAFEEHRKGCNLCRLGPGRCEGGQRLYAAACASVMDQARVLL